MINLSNYHSNGLPTAVWSNKVNLIGEKVYKPKLHFCEHCNKPILIYGRLIPCKHVFCFSCATLCLTQPSNRSNSLARSPPQPHNNGGMHHNNYTASPHEPPLPPPPNHQPYHRSPPTHNNNNSIHGNSIKSYNDHHNHHSRRRTPTRGGSYGGSNSKNLDLHRSDSNHSFSSRDNERHGQHQHHHHQQQQQQQGSLLNLDESTSNTTNTTIQQDMSIDSPSLNGVEGTCSGNNKGSGSSSIGKGCHRCGGRALRVERNTLNSIFVCQIESCRRTYLSARDLQAHVNHRHARSKTGHSAKNSSASLAAISASPYISSSTLLHLNSQHSSRGHPEQHPDRDHSSRRNSNNNNNNTGGGNNHSSKSPANNYPNNHHPYHNRHTERDGPPARHPRDNPRDRFRDRDNYQRDRERERDSKEYHRQSLQRAAQWAEQSAQIMEKGLTR